MKNLKHNGIWLMAMMTIIFTAASIFFWHSFMTEAKAAKTWNSPSWISYLTSVAVLIFSGWFAYQAYYKIGRLFWILYALLTTVTIAVKSGFLNEHACMIACIRYTSQAILWGSAFLLCAVHGASIFVIRKKVQNQSSEPILKTPVE